MKFVSPPLPHSRPVELAVSPGELDLRQTLESGQAFRWYPLEGVDGWFGWIGGRPVWLLHSEGVLRAWGVPRAPGAGGIRGFFDLDRPVREIVESFPIADPLLREAVRLFPGLRLMRQAPWEALLSFVLSSNKNIPHIRQCIERLCRRFGAEVPLGANGPVLHTWPEPAALAVAEEIDLRGCAIGYRAPYIHALARMVDTGAIDLQRPATLDYPEAQAYLQRIPGVGPKIADCVLLFAYGFGEAFPVDVWIERVLRAYDIDRRRLRPADKARAVQRLFGPNAGYAQQYLFHWARRYWRQEQQ